MAILIRGVTTCSICAQVLSASDEVVLFPHFIQEPAHPLWRYSDSSMHAACFASWQDAEAFRAIYNQVWPELVPNHPREMLADGSIVKTHGQRPASD